MNKDPDEFEEIGMNTTFNEIVDIVLKTRKPKIDAAEEKTMSFADGLRTTGKAAKPKD